MKAAFGLVYSTDSGRTCPDCRQAVAACICRAKHAVQTGDGIVRVGRETKGRGGKAVTTIKGLALAPEPLAELAKQLKVACGTGGTVKEGTVEIQGDHAERLVQVLKAKGFNVKRSGG